DRQIERVGHREPTIEELEEARLVEAWTAPPEFEPRPFDLRAEDVRDADPHSITGGGQLPSQGNIGHDIAVRAPSGQNGSGHERTPLCGSLLGAIRACRGSVAGAGAASVSEKKLSSSRAKASGCSSWQESPANGINSRRWAPPMPSKSCFAQDVDQYSSSQPQ